MEISRRMRGQRSCRIARPPSAAVAAIGMASPIARMRRRTGLPIGQKSCGPALKTALVFRSSAG
jgi:hypothetical protein